MSIQISYYCRPAWLFWGKWEWIYSVSPEISFRMTPTHSAIIHHHHLSLSSSTYQQNNTAEALEFSNKDKGGCNLSHFIYESNKNCKDPVCGWSRDIISWVKLITSLLFWYCCWSGLVLLILMTITMKKRKKRKVFPYYFLPSSGMMAFYFSLCFFFL